MLEYDLTIRCWNMIGRLGVGVVCVDQMWEWDWCDTCGSSIGRLDVGL